MGAPSKSPNAEEEVVGGEGKQDSQLITIRMRGLCRCRMKSIPIYIALKDELFYRHPFTSGL